MHYKRVARISIIGIGVVIVLGSVFLDVIQTGAFGGFGYFQAGGVILGLLAVTIGSVPGLTKRVLTAVVKNSPLILGSILITLVLVEIVLRQFFYPVAVSSDYRRPDPVLGWRLEPNIHITVQNIEFTIPLETNSRGWRDVEHTFEKPPGTFRIVVLGDSFMEAYSVALEDAFHRQLQALISESQSTQVEVINLGVGGYGTLQEYLAFAEEGVRYQPDLVLLAFYTTNDVRDNSLQLESRYGQGIKVESRPFLLPGGPDDWEITIFDYEGTLQQYEAHRAEESAQKPWYAWDNLAIARLIEEVQLRQARQSWTRSEASVDQNLYAWIGVNRCQMADEYQQAWDITERVFVRLNREVQQAGAKLVVFDVPGMHEVDSDYIAQVKALDPNHEYCLDTLPGNAYLNDLLSGMDAPLIDLVPAFRQEESQGVELFRSVDQHWNEAGHALAAQEVYRYLLEKHLLPQ